MLSLLLPTLSLLLPLLPLLPLTLSLCYVSFLGSAAHGYRPHWESPSAAGLHHSDYGPGSIHLPAQQPQPWHCTPPPGCSCPSPHPASPLHLYRAHSPRLHRHRSPPGGLPRFSTPHCAAHCLSGRHRPPSPREHGAPGPTLTHHPPQSVSSPVCPSDLHQRLASLHRLHWIPTESCQGQPIPLHINTGGTRREGVEELPTDLGSWGFILQVPHTNNANGAGRGDSWDRSET